MSSFRSLASSESNSPVLQVKRSFSLRIPFNFIDSKSNLCYRSLHWAANYFVDDCDAYKSFFSVLFVASLFANVERSVVISYSYC